ncbi:hypothetical protein RJ639_010102 [Escallonia herrerae]|uniref:Uncharacterized protein n=1 Tax=Escallonia herrerae TaxID=1293975 RepID=A0AA88VT09_9ASTE|nr:hypothetical protein RJ639_010102 [Escallonia herrerae]
MGGQLRQHRWRGGWVVTAVAARWAGGLALWQKRGRWATGAAAEARRLRSWAPPSIDSPQFQLVLKCLLKERRATQPTNGITTEEGPLRIFVINPATSSDASILLYGTSFHAMVEKETGKSQKCLCTNGEMSSKSEGGKGSFLQLLQKASKGKRKEKVGKQVKDLTTEKAKLFSGAIRLEKKYAKGKKFEAEDGDKAI